MLESSNEIFELHKQLTKQTEIELELDNVLALITKHCLTSQGRELISNSDFSDINILNNELNQVQEMFDMITTDEPIPLSRIENVKELIKRAKIDGAVLEIQELKHIVAMVRVAREIKSFINSRKIKYPLIYQEINAIYDDKSLIKKLDSTIDENENIRDNATPELFKIRAELRDKNSKLHSKMTKLVREYSDADLVNDDFYTIKDGRFVLSIKATHKRKLPGIVHGVSQTGSTVYLEPNTAVELNNELSLLHSAELREIHSILQALTRQVATNSTQLLALYDTLSHIDSINSKAQYATDNGGIKPTISDTKMLELKKVFHPLLVNKLGAKNVVPLTISFSAEQRGHLISGPNAGGKTIAMKTVGLSIMLAQRGIFPLGELIFCPLNIYSSIGDGQSVEHNLSTFSFQLTRLKQILDVVNIANTAPNFSTCHTEYISASPRNDEGIPQQVRYDINDDEGIPQQVRYDINDDEGMPQQVRYDNGEARYGMGENEQTPIEEAKDSSRFSPTVIDTANVVAKNNKTNFEINVPRQEREVPRRDEQFLVGDEQFLVGTRSSSSGTSSSSSGQEVPRQGREVPRRGEQFLVSDEQFLVGTRSSSLGQEVVGDFGEICKNLGDFGEFSSDFTDFSSGANERKIEENKSKIEENRGKNSKNEGNNSKNPNSFNISTFQIFEELEKKAKSLQKFNALLNELVAINDEKECAINDFADKLKTAVNTTKYQLDEKENIGINVTSIEQTRGVSYKIMILCGAIEGQFPLSFRTDKFLGKELPNSEQIHNDSEKILFYRYLTNNIPLLEAGEMQFYIFFPATLNKIKTIRSSFIDDLCDIIDEKSAKKHIVDVNADTSSHLTWRNYVTTNMDLVGYNKNEIDFNKNNVINKNYENKHNNDFNDSIVNGAVADNRNEIRFVNEDNGVANKTITVNNSANFNSYSSDVFDNNKKVDNNLGSMEDVCNSRAYKNEKDVNNIGVNNAFLHNNNSNNKYGESSVFDIAITGNDTDRVFGFNNNDYENSDNNYERILENNVINENNFKEIIKENVYSVSQLETFAGCGLKYFYNYVLNVKDEDETEDYTFSSLDAGNYFHKILYNFYKSLKKEEGNDENNSNEINPLIENDKLLEKLLAIADNELKNFKEIDVFRYEVERIKKTLVDWFTNEKEKLVDWDFSSDDFEFKFENVEINGLKIRGIIDRIEVNADKNEVLVADYKLSLNGVKKEKDVLAGKSLQVPLYLLALKELEKYKNYNPADGVYYVLNSKKGMVHKLVAKHKIEELLEVALEKAIEYKNKIERLEFPILNYWENDSKKVCKYCNYNQFCRIMDVKRGLGRKRKRK